MKKLIPALAILSIILTGCYSVMAQTPGLIHTVAGGGSATTEGIAATSYRFSTTAGIWTDGSGNIYVSDEYNSKIKKIDAATGLIYTVAGNGSGGFSGDGGPATNAKIGGVRSIRIDGANNLYLGDYGNSRIRRVDAATGIITTIAGGGTSNAEGVPATSANLGFLGIDVDLAGNVYTYGNSRIRKVDAVTGLINTIGGGGTSNANGVPATSASISRPRWMLSDPAGNLFFLDAGGGLIRRIDAATGLINTVAGGGSLTGDGVLATNFSFSDHHSFSIDPAGNLILMDRTYGLIRKVDASTGIMKIIYGGGSSFIEGMPATSANIRGTHWLHIDNAGNFYITDWSNGNARRINDYPFIGWGGGFSSDSFTVQTNKRCNGAELIVKPKHYSTGMIVKTDFGDATSDVSPIIPGYISGGYAIINHTYNTSGTYTITQVLYKGSTPVDTLIMPYTYAFCRSLPVKIYYEGNGNGIKDPSETFMSAPSVAVVDSNGIAVDTIPATGGFNYSAYASPGSVYSFRLLSKPGDLVLACPSSGVIQDTVLSAITTYPDKYFGLSCPTFSSYDLGVKSVVPVTGVNDQWGDIFVTNKACLGSGGTVTLYFSPKWVFDVSRARPAVTSSTSNSATWTISSIKSGDPKPLDLYYVLWSNPLTGKLSPRDTVHSRYVVTPSSGDVDPSNNTQDRLDTVRAGCDPNDISVQPAGNILPCTELEYTINFENTGNDTAHNIYVMDTLPVGVDVSSMRIVMASARMDLSIIKDGPYTIARFDFPNINLLDSSFRDACHGSVIYTIKANAGLPDGTQLPNHAGIFFDVNDVVMTNTVVNTIGILPIDGKGSTCIGTTDTLTNATPGGVWTASNANATVVNGVVTGVTAGLDTISYTVSNACTSQTKTKIVTIGSVVAAPISGPSGVCLGSTITLTDATTGGIWKSSKPAIASISSSGVVTGLIAGTSFISYTVTNACGSDVATAVVNVYPLPAAFAVLGGGSFCSGGAGVHLGLSSSKAGVNYQAYIGATKVGVAVPGIGGILDLGIFTTPGIYTVVAENATTTCTENMTGSASVTVDPTVVPGIIIVSTSDTVCSGNVVTYLTSDVNGGTAPTFQWNVNGVAIVGATGATYSYPPATGDVVTVLMKSSATCALPDTTSSSVYPTVIASLLPTVLVSAYPGTNISKGESITLTAAVTDAGTTPTYQWIVNGTPVAGATMATYTYNKFADNDSVSCQVTSSGDCGGHTAHYSAIIHVSTVGVRTMGNSTISIYPNPVSDELTINTEKQYSSFTITNSIGQVMMEQPLSGVQTKVNVKTLSAGLYYISLRGSEGVTVQKFVKL